MPPGTDAWAQLAGIRPAPIIVRHLAPLDARGLFIRRFEELR
jgi:hypothetical protein